MFAYYAREVLMVALMVFGFGFVVFFHELGHFLAAKWVGIKVEQFAVGFGHALFAWRKGIGWKFGSTHPEYTKRIEKHLEAKEKSELKVKEKTDYSDDQVTRAAEELGLGETEYRLNWVPLGGYVKMLGQDDLKANAGTDDPRAYNRKSIGARMLVVSAGVIMNIILAGIGFMVLFLMGFNAPAPIVGKVLTNSPADLAGIQVGDRILTIDGTRQYDFSRVVLTTALLRESRDVPVEIERTKPDGSKEKMTLSMRPAKMSDDPKSFLGIGVGPAEQLRGPRVLREWQEKKAEDARKMELSRQIPESAVINPGDVIIAIDGKPIHEGEGDADQVKFGYAILDRALQQGQGAAVPITVRNKDGATRTEHVIPRIEQSFGDRKVNVAGMEPRPRVQALTDKSSVEGKLHPGDVIIGIALPDKEVFPDIGQVRDFAIKAGSTGRAMTVSVERDGKAVDADNIIPKTHIQGKGVGLGIGLDYDESAVVSQVIDGSPAKKAGILAGSKIIAIDGKSVSNWFAVQAALASGTKHQLSVLSPGESAVHDVPLQMTPEESAGLAHTLHPNASLELEELRVIRQTNNPLVATGWGVIETRDLILQFYVTIARMFQGSVSYSNMMGPLGIVTAGAQFALRGSDWLIWFLSMISANLAVVNFLPIPIVDGGLFTFLILEKIQGKPLSPKTQAIAQVVGFALIISVFLLVTYQDIRRQIGL